MKRGRDPPAKPSREGIKRPPLNLRLRSFRGELSHDANMGPGYERQLQESRKIRANRADELKDVAAPLGVRMQWRVSQKDPAKLVPTYRTRPSPRGAMLGVGEFRR